MWRASGAFFPDRGCAVTEARIFPVNPAFERKKLETGVRVTHSSTVVKIYSLLHERVRQPYHQVLFRVQNPKNRIQRFLAHQRRTVLRRHGLLLPDYGFCPLPDGLLQFQRCGRGPVGGAVYPVHLRLRLCGGFHLRHHRHTAHVPDRLHHPHRRASHHGIRAGSEPNRGLRWWS